MNFKALNEEELNDRQFTLLKDGIYHFRVHDASDEISKSSGNDMIKLTLEIRDKENVRHLVFDHLVEAMAYKLKHFCDATGLIDKYNLGQINAVDCLGKGGRVSIKQSLNQPRPEGGYFPDKNVVSDYVKLKPSTNQVFNPNGINAISTGSTKVDFVDSELPF